MEISNSFPKPYPFMVRYLLEHWNAIKQSFLLWKYAPFDMLINILVMTIAFILPLFLWFALVNIQHFSAYWDKGTQIIVFLKKDLPIQEVQNTALQWSKLSAVQNIKVIMPDAALQEFESLSGLSNTSLFLGTNPLPVVLEIQPKIFHPVQIEKLLQIIQKEKNVDIVQANITWVKRLYTWFLLGYKIIYVLILIFASTIIIIMSHTIRVLMQDAQEEIQVLKLMGATERYIARPFLYIGMLNTLISAGLALCALQGLIIYLRPILEKIALLYHTKWQIWGVDPAYIAVFLVSSVIFGYLSAYCTIKYYIYTHNKLQGI